MLDGAGHRMAGFAGHGYWAATTAAARGNSVFHLLVAAAVADLAI